MDKLEVALIALVIGWGLSQLTELIKSTYKIKKLKLAISLELQDLEILLDESNKTAKKSALEYGHDHKYTYSLSPPISTPVLDAFYCDVADSFTVEQRYNIRVFRDNIRTYNSIVESLEKNSSGTMTQNEIVFKLFEAYKKAAFASLYIHEANKVGGTVKITNDHKAINKLRDELPALSEQLAFKS